MRGIRTILILLLFTVTFSACKKEKKINPEFKWFVNGRSFHYDYYSAAGIQKDYLHFGIASNYIVQYIDTSKAYLNLDNIYGAYVVKEDGLYATGNIGCQIGGILNFTFNYLYAPDNPSAGQQVPVLGCGKQFVYNINILAINQTITVPQGTFTTYIMQYRNGEKAYWDTDNGLIMYEIHDYYGNIAGTLKLSGISY